MIKKMIRAGLTALLACASLVFIVGCDPDGDENAQPSPGFLCFVVQCVTQCT